MDGVRLRAEQVFHDRQARMRAQTFSQSPHLFRVVDDAYLDHESWIRPAIEKLGPLEGMRVLDFGCGHAMASVIMARQGARVVGLDLSQGYLAEARQRAAHNGVQLGLLMADGNRLPFADGSFDRIWGNAILHHLDLAKVATEIARVLAPGGIAVFCEPWGENWLLRLARGRLGYPSKERTVDEEPLRQKDLAIFKPRFADMEVEGYQLLAMVARVLGRGRRLASLDRCDRLLLGRLPGLRRYCRYVVLTLRRPRALEAEAAGPVRCCSHGTAQSSPCTSASET
jgi:SAM-dependent methyltransferase